MKKIAALLITLTVCLGLTRNAYAYPPPYPYHYPTTTDTVMKVINTVSDIADPYNNRYYYNRIAMDNYYLRERERLDRERLLAERLRMERCHNHKFGPHWNNGHHCYNNYRY